MKPRNQDSKGRRKTIKITLQMDPYDYNIVKTFAKEGRFKQRALTGMDTSAALARIIREWQEGRELAPPFLSVEELSGRPAEKKARSLAGAMRLIEEGLAKIEQGLGLLKLWRKSVDPQAEEAGPAQSGAAAADREQPAEGGLKRQPAPGDEDFIHPPFP